jgi:hypothetical protein
MMGLEASELSLFVIDTHLPEASSVPTAAPWRTSSTGTAATSGPPTCRVVYRCFQSEHRRVEIQNGRTRLKSLLLLI